MRLFVAVWPPADVVDAIRSLPRPSTPDVRWSTEDQWHVTLRFLGSIDDVDEVVAALAAIGAPAATVTVGPETARLGSGVLMLPVRGLDDVAAAVHAATDGLAPPPDHRFRGHLTLARARNRGTVPRALTGTPFDETWTASSIALVRSQTKSTGAVYTDVATFPLA